MNRAVADTHAAAFNRMQTATTTMSYSSCISSSSTAFNRMAAHAESPTRARADSGRALLSDSTRAVAGSTERARGRDGYAAFYSKPKQT